MKRILVALHSGSAGSTAVTLACALAHAEGAQLTGVFVETPSVWPVVVPAPDGATPLMIDALAAAPRMSEETVAHMRTTLAGFAETCARCGIQHTVYTAGAATEDALIHLTEYADGLVMDATLPGMDITARPPTLLVRSVLAEARCPVIVAPVERTKIRELCLAYDGSASSVFAIKQATYLLPHLRDRPVRVLEVRHDSATPLGDDGLLKAWLDAYFSAVTFDILEGAAERVLPAHLAARHDVLLVMGAFGRSVLSTFFRPSTAEKMLKAPGYAVFIAHG